MVLGSSGGAVLQETAASDRATTSRGWWAAVLVVTALALGLRLVAIDAQSFWYDEAVSAHFAKASFADLLSGKVKDNGNPPLYGIALRAWAASFGQSDISLRMLSVFCGVLTVPLLALLGRRLLDPKTGLFAAGLLAISPLEVELSNEARTYALTHLFAVANMLLFVVWTQRRRWSDLLLYAVTMALSWSSHYYAPALPLAQAAPLLFVPRLRKLILPWLGSLVLAALLWSPCLPIFLDQIRTPGNLSRIPGESWQAQFLATPIAFALGRTFAWRGSPSWMFGLAALGTLIGFLAPAVRGVLALWRDRFAGTLLLGWLLIPILGPLVVALLLAPMYSHRYGAIGLPAFLLIVAYGLVLMRRWARMVLLAVLLGFTAVSLVRYATVPLKEDWRSASQVILANARAGEPALFDTDIEVVTFLHYARKSGNIPDQLIGLVSAPDARGEFHGVEYRQGQSTTPEPVRGFLETFSAPGAWVALCIPNGSPDDYKALFAKHGFRVAETTRFHRIVILHFVKNDHP